MVFDKRFDLKIEFKIIKNKNNKKKVLLYLKLYDYLCIM